MPKDSFTFTDIKKIFNDGIPKTTFLDAEKAGNIPPSRRIEYGNVTRRAWDYSVIGKIGEKYGYLDKPKNPSCVTLFSTKGGVLKSTIVLNIARMYGLHNVKTCVIDLDPQGDTSRNLGLDIDDPNPDLDSVNEYFDVLPSLMQLYDGKLPLEDIIQNTEITGLDVVPSSSSLIPLMDLLNSKKRREYWLKENVVEPLYKLGYDLVIIDLAPSWTLYTSMAITSADLLISPIECKVAHYRNVNEFIRQLDQFGSEMKIEDQKRIFVPTKVTSSKKISMQILNSYNKNIEHCSYSSIRETIIGEEAIALKQSIIEYKPTSPISEDIKALLQQINTELK